MKAVILASLATVVSFVVITALFRWWRIERGARALLCVFSLGLGLVVVTEFSTFSDIFALPGVLATTPRWFDIASSIFFFTAAFFGGILQIYNLADRGFSLRILIDLHEHPNRRGTVNSLFHGYSDGRGIGWMYQKRIDDMLRNGLITVNGENLVLTDRGARTARVFRALRRIFRFDED